MNVVGLYGGLGNQLFQYAFGKAQMKNGIEVRYNLDWYSNSKRQKYPRNYLLNKFNTNVETSKFLPQKNIKEHIIGFNTNLLYTKDANFEGYWQYIQYFNHIKSQLQFEFSLKHESYAENTNFFATKSIIALSDISISVHIRRGDYLIAGFSIVPFSYYYEAINQLQGDVYIFSDDLEWCTEKFKQEYFSNKIYFIDIEDYLAFDLMRHCTHNIIANSTFSWWAAYLNEYKDKIIYTPDWWMTQKENKPYLTDNWKVC